MTAKPLPTTHSSGMLYQSAQRDSYGAIMQRKQYIEFLSSTPVNYTASYLAEHLATLSHDAVSDFLNRERIKSDELWDIVKDRIHDTEASYLIIDDSVQAKPYARAIELVDYHYSGNEHAVIRGIDIVNLVHSDGQGTYYPIDYRIYAVSYDRQTKNDHFIAMLKQAFEVRYIQAKYVLFDSWYASMYNLRYIHQQQRIFYTTLKENRLVSPSKEAGYVHLDTLTWSAEQLEYGIRVKLKELPFYVTLFKRVAKNGDIEWLITNDPEHLLMATVACQRSDVRWDVEQFHRELKQLTGIERCQARSAWAQRNHIACCYHAWVAIKVYAQRCLKTLYRAKYDLISDYLRAELVNPRICAVIGL